MLNDIRGLPNIPMGRHPPCHCGSCLYCVVPGLTVGSGNGATVIPSAVRALPPDHYLRAQWAREFGRNQAYDKLTLLATCARPRPRNHRGAIESGQRTQALIDEQVATTVLKKTNAASKKANKSWKKVLAAWRQANKGKKNKGNKRKREPEQPPAAAVVVERPHKPTGPMTEAFFGVDVYSELLPYHDKVRHNLYDVSHELANTIKKMIGLTGNGARVGASTVVSKESYVGPKREWEENVLGRFRNCVSDKKLDDKKKKNDKSFVPARFHRDTPRKKEKHADPLPWVTTDRAQNLIDTMPDVCKRVAGWPALRKLFKDRIYLKTSEWLQYAGPVGAYCAQFMDCDPEVRDLFIDLMYALAAVQGTYSKAKTREWLRTELPEIYTKLEMKLPYYFMTFVNHVLAFHIVDLLEAIGGYSASNMMSYERYIYMHARTAT
jgi:hypothetical protein